MAVLERLMRRHFAPAAPAVAPPVETMPPRAAREAVARGGDLLTRWAPDWYLPKYIDLTALDVANGERCVLAQFGRNHPLGRALVSQALKRLTWQYCGNCTYGAMQRALGISIPGVPQSMGFLASDKGATYEELTQAWRDYIVALRCR